MFRYILITKTVALKLPLYSIFYIIVYPEVLIELQRKHTLSASAEDVNQ